MKKALLIYSALFYMVLVSGCSDSQAAPQIDVRGFPAARDGKTLACTASYQEHGPGTAPVETALLLEKQDEQQLILGVEHAGFGVQVVWHYSLTTLYMTVKKDSTKMFSTARIPSQDHNESMIDLTMENGSRIYVSCWIEEYKSLPR